MSEHLPILFYSLLYILFFLMPYYDSKASKVAPNVPHLLVPTLCGLVSFHFVLGLRVVQGSRRNGTSLDCKDHGFHLDSHTLYLLNHSLWGSNMSRERMLKQSLERTTRQQIQDLASNWGLPTLMWVSLGVDHSPVEPLHHCTSGESWAWTQLRPSKWGMWDNDCSLF